jgi:hypothetical protein
MNIIDTQGCEFGYEIIMCVPYANFLKVNNKNLIVYSCKDTRCLYYFLDDHEHSEMYRNRRHSKPIGVHFKDIHFDTLDKSQFIFPDFKGYYSNQNFDFDTDKELLIISNKYNKEWLKPPINFISTEALDALFHHLSDKYTVVYNRASTKNIVNDNSDLLEFNDCDIVRNHPGVIDANHLYDDYDISFNLFQMLLYSRCNRFISVQGGTSILSSIFGGTNIIFAKNGSEINCGAYDNWYSELSNCRVLHTNQYDVLIQLALEEFKA